jgi:predicted nucleic acid-binding protein
MARRPFAADTSVLVASLLTWHEHHEAALQALERAIAERPLFLPIPVLVETYAVMTRLPAPYRVSPSDAHALLRDNFSAARVEGISGAGCWNLLSDLSERRVAGGRTYDAQIVAAAVQASAELLLTLNLAHFAALAPAGLEVRSPLAP